ncbi:hypothetical protein Rhe02_86290 [Rhizocola hellebori]|uniref:Uncharacterized protein n=1 Tax=Rhizocola hellebori TaxID=1392758 RepID=A0A8J3QIC1_9ACTN|nr:hypothetical protein Rhe02_86290 [Rhizocola hellebori]
MVRPEHGFARTGATSTPPTLGEVSRIIRSQFVTHQAESDMPVIDVCDDFLYVFQGSPSGLHTPAQTGQWPPGRSAGRPQNAPGGRDTQSRGAN